MSLPTSSNTKFRLCVLVSDEQVQALLLAVNQAGAVIKSSSERRGYNSPESCVLRLDECLRELGSESESVNEVVFGLQPDWVTGNSIAKSKTSLLHKLTTELSLQAVGFVVTTEAVLEQELVQHPSFSGTVCVVSSTQLFVLLSVQGSVIGVEQVGRSGTVGADMAETIARLATHLEPGARFPDHILLASLDLPDAQLKAFEQDCLRVDWSGVDALGKVPVIRTVSQTEYATIVAIGAGRATDLPQESGSVVAPASARTATQLASADAGFSEVKTSEGSVAPSPAVATSFGIPISSDKLLTKADSKRAQELLAELEAAPTLHRRRFTHKHGVMLGVLAGIVTLALGYVVAALFFSTVIITITPAVQSLSEAVEITLDPNLLETDPVSRSLAAKPITKEVTGTEDILTTGVEIVGEKAHGKVTIFNKVTAEKILSAGTTFKSGSQEFTLDKDVTLASASAKESNGETVIKHSETEATITAKNIGVEGNLAKGSKFTIGDFATSTYEAEVEDAFTGGASREVRVVAEADKKALLDDLTTNLVKQATEELEGETVEGTYVIPPTGYKVVQAKYDAEPKTEAERLSLTLTVQIQSLSYTAADLRPIAQAVLSDKVPEGYQLSEADPQILSSLEEPAGTASGSAKLITLSAQVTSQAEPQFDQTALLASVLGNPLAEAQRLLQSDARVTQSNFRVEPSLFAPLVRSVPDDANRVTLTVVEQ